MKHLNSWQDKAIGAWLAIISIFQLYTATVGIFQPRIQRGIHLLFLLPAAFVLFPTLKKNDHKGVGFINWILAAVSIFPPLYIVYFHERLSERLEFVDEVLPVEMLLGGVMILLLLEAVRRAVVPAMAFLIAGFFVYLYAAPYLPSVFYAKPISLAEIIEMQFLITDAGIFGSITGVSATFVALFVIFGAFMEATRTGQFFTDLACRVAGKSHGGPAKIAVISSGLFGSISGVAAANVYSTGVFTIPLMKKLGYRRRFAGAVEAAASTGGMLMPPVMGAGAFVMAEITGISYINIVIAAMLGSILLYASMVIRVHYTALREHLSGVGASDMVPFIQIAKDSYLLIPMILLVVLLLKGFSPFLAANAAILVTFIISFARKKTWMTPARIWSTLRLAGQNMVMIALACAGAGMVVAIVTHTGLALGIATVITNWSGGQMLPALLLIMVTSLVMGMGLPCTPAYIIAITIGGPALLAMGADMLAAHLFVYYFAVLAGVTPPVCVPAFCAASIANSKPLQTGFEAFKLAMAGFVIPYIFIYNPALLMQGSVLEIVSVVLGLLLAITFFAGALSRYFFVPLNRLQQAALLALAIGTGMVCAIPALINSFPVRLLLVVVLSGLGFWRFFKKGPAT